MELNIDKTGWKSYRFDEFAQNISQRVEPKQTDLEIYVGLEHLDPDSLHIKRNGTPADVEGTKLKFYKGDVIFGKRRAYQRKAALAETDGICSAHAMVLRANTKLIDERLFPFFFHSKVFQDIAVKISVGGLSPTINWKDLAKQEFLLPPKDQQARLAELLWAADEVVEREREVKERLENALKLYVAKECGTCNNGNYLLNIVGLVKIHSLLSNIKFNVGKLDTTEYKLNGEYPIVDQSMNFIVGYSNTKEIVFDGDLPVLVFGDHTTIIKYIDFPFILGADGTKIISPNKNKVLPKFLYYAIKNLNLIPQGYRRHYSILKDLMIPVFEINKQRSILERIDEFEKPIDAIKIQIENSQKIKHALINEIF